MKLRTLAALLIRLVAIVAGIDALVSLLDAIVEPKVPWHAFGALVPLLGSYVLIRHSKKLGELLCRGLEDEV